MLSFRIISGQHKGRRLRAPKNLPVRPTTDRAKEALFNILTNQIDLTNSHLLDLYAGTGSISYEFLSRGGQTSTAVDKHRGCLAFINETAHQLKLPIQTIQSDVTSFLEKNKQPFEFIFMDPPFSFTREQFALNLDLILQSDWFASGLLVLEHPPEIEWNDREQCIESRRYGGSHFSFFSTK